MLGALIHFWVQLAGVSGGEKTYTGSSILIKIYPTLSLAIRGRDGMDGGGGHWMMHSNYRTHHQSRLSGRFLAVVLIWQGFRVGKNVFRLYYTIKTLLCDLFSYWGVGQDGLQRGTLDDMFYKWNTSSITALGGSSSLLGTLGAQFFAATYVYLSG